jgi:hypothetical protein
LQQIISNPPSLITTDTAFNYNNNNLLSSSDNAPIAMLIDSNANTSNTVDPISVTSMLSIWVNNHFTSLATTDYQHNNCNNNNSPLSLFFK